MSPELTHAVVWEVSAKRREMIDATHSRSKAMGDVIGMADDGDAGRGVAHD